MWLAGCDTAGELSAGLLGAGAADSVGTGAAAEDSVGTGAAAEDSVGTGAALATPLLVTTGAHAELDATGADGSADWVGWATEAQLEVAGADGAALCGGEEPPLF